MINNETEFDYPEEREPDIVPKFKIFSYPQDTTLSGYFHLWQEGDLYIPEFQREYVWDISKASKLIESFILGVPVPNIFLYKKEDDNRYWIIDGQQRIKTILSFLTGEFVDGNLSDDEYEDVSRKKVFRLRGLENDTWNGKTFEELDDKIQSVLKKTVLRSVIINQTDSRDKESIYYIFERLNTGGVLLSPMEIRMCISDGVFASLLKKLNSDENWRKIINKSQQDKRRRDIEWILRIFALHDNLQNYAAPMKSFLNKYMRENASANKEWLEEKEKKFRCTIEKALLLPSAPFNISERFNLSTFDSIFVALMHVHNKDLAPSMIENAHKKLMEPNSEYLKTVSIGKGTGSEAIVKKRIRLAREAFENS